MNLNPQEWGITMRETPREDIKKMGVRRVVKDH
jgi:hypothetical protein